MDIQFTQTLNRKSQTVIMLRNDNRKHYKHFIWKKVDRNSLLLSIDIIPYFPSYVKCNLHIFIKCKNKVYILR